MNNYIGFLLVILLTLTSAFSVKAQCNIDAGADLFICVDKYGEIDTTSMDASFLGDSALNFRWKCEYWYAGVSKFTASDFMDDTTAVKAKISNLGIIENEDEVVFVLEAYDSSGTVHCSDSMVVTFSFFSALLTSTSAQINQGDTTQIWTTSIGGIGSLNYSWTPNYNMSDSTASSPYVWPDTTTVYYCTVKDSVGCESSYGDEFDVFVRAVSIPELAFKNVKLSVFPNPVNDNTTVKVSNLTDFTFYSYQLKDVKGRLIKSDQLSSNVKVGDLLNKSGVYFFNLYYYKQLVKTKKLIKQ